MNGHGDVAPSLVVSGTCRGLLTFCTVRLVKRLIEVGDYVIGVLAAHAKTN